MSDLKIDGERLRHQEGSWLPGVLGASVLGLSGVLATTPIWSDVAPWQAAIGAGLLGTVGMLGLMVPGRRILEIDRVAGRLTFEVLGLVKRVRNEHSIEEVVAVRLAVELRTASLFLVLRDGRGVPVAQKWSRARGVSGVPPALEALGGHLAGFLGRELQR